MSFYVYKPVNVPRDFYVTYDGYLVYRDNSGVWRYGTAEQGGITKTGYVVGSVIPSVVRLKPYNVHISSVAPVMGSNRVVDGTGTEDAPKSSRVVYTPPESGLETVNTELTPGAADWTQNSNFMAISKWQKSVDRIGVISHPAIPVAWKGEKPEVIYAWTGTQWRQISAKGSKISAMSTIRRELYDLTVYVNQLNRLRWTDEDSRVLEQYAGNWGYKWQGMIIPGKVYR